MFAAIHAMVSLEKSLFDPEFYKERCGIERTNAWMDSFRKVGKANKFLMTSLHDCTMLYT